MFSDLAWLLKDHLKSGFFRKQFCRDLNNFLRVTSLCSSTSTVDMPCTLVMNIPKIYEFRADIVRAAKINFLAP